MTGKIKNMKTFVCYYSKYDENGEMIDNFSEWCSAKNLIEARDIFRDRYPNLSIDLINER